MQIHTEKKVIAYGKIIVLYRLHQRVDRCSSFCYFVYAVCRVSSLLINSLTMERGKDYLNFMHDSNFQILFSALLVLYITHLVLRYNDHIIYD